jgi:hypothetical protein
MEELCPINQTQGLGVNPVKNKAQIRVSRKCCAYQFEKHQLSTVNTR